MRLAAALSLGTVTGERRNEKLLLASFTNTQQFAPWMDALAEAGARLAGVFSVPLVAPQLAARLGTKSGRCILVSVNRAGLRQSYIENGRLRFARLEGTPEMDSGMMSAFVAREVFVSSLAVIFNIADTDQDSLQNSLLGKMREATLDDGSKLFTTASVCGLSTAA